MPPGMVHVSLAQLEVCQQRAVGINDVQVADPAAGVRWSPSQGTGQGWVGSMISTDETKKRSPILTIPCGCSASNGRSMVSTCSHGIAAGDGQHAGHDGVVLSMTLRRRSRWMQDEGADEHTDRSQNRCLDHGPSSCGNRFRPLPVQDGTPVTTGELSGGEQGVTGHNANCRHGFTATANRAEDHRRRRGHDGRAEVPFGAGHDRPDGVITWRGYVASVPGTPPIVGVPRPSVEAHDYRRMVVNAIEPARGHAHATLSEPGVFGWVQTGRRAQGSDHVSRVLTGADISRAAAPRRVGDAERETGLCLVRDRHLGAGRVVYRLSTQI